LSAIFEAVCTLPRVLYEVSGNAALVEGSGPRRRAARVLQPGGARYGGGCNPDATRMQPGCNGPKVSQPGGGRAKRGGR